MTTAADDFAVEEALEAFLAGRPVPEQGVGLAAFAEAVRSTAASPGRPSAALADLLATGLLIDQSSPSDATASRTRRHVRMLLPALFARFAAAGFTTQAATGAAAVLVVFTGAGAAGALPDPLQHGFATVADTVGIHVEDPQDTSTAGDGTTQPTDDPATHPQGSETGEAPLVVTDPTQTATGAHPAGAEDDQLTLAEWTAGPAPDQLFGDWVSSGARHGYVDDATIRYWAYRKHVDWPQDDATQTQRSGGAGDDGDRGSRDSSGDDSDGSRHGSGDSGSDRDD